MSDYIATARVRVVGDLTGFREKLRTDIKKSAGTLGAIKVPVIADVKPFKQKIERELRRTPILIPVSPDLKGFRQELLAKLKRSTAGITVRIPVEVAQAAARAQRRPTAPRPTQAPGVDPIGNIANIQRATQATKQFTNAQKDELSVKKERARLENTLTSQRQSVLRSIGDETVAISRVNDLRRAEARINRELTNVSKARDAALKLGNVAKADELRILQRSLVVQKRGLDAPGATQGVREQIAATKDAAKAQRDLDAASRAAASRQAFVARGAGATALSFLKIRGATLAANAEFLAGAAAIAVFAKALQGAAELEQNLNVFAITADATATQMERAGEQARELGRDVTLPAVSAADAAESFTNLAKAGLDVENSLAGARGVLQLATAAQIDNAQATELVASALNSFTLAGTQATRVADLLTGAANESQGSITDIGIALQQSSAAARQAGISLEDTVALLTLLAKNGLRGSDAGTSLRTALLRLIRPTTKAQEELDKLNVRIRDAEGNIRANVFADLGAQLGELSNAQRDATLAIIFGQDAFRSAAILGREGASGLDAMRTATQEQGLAAELAAARTAGLIGEVEALKNNLETLGSTLGGIAIPAISTFTGEVTQSVASVQSLVQGIKDITGTIPDVPGGGLLSNLIGGPQRFLFKEVNFLREETSALIGVLKQGEGVSFERPTSQLRELRSEFTDSVDDAEDLLATLGRLTRASAGGGGAEGGRLPAQFREARVEAEGLAKSLSQATPNQIVDSLSGLLDNIEGSGEEAQKLRAQLEGVIRVVLALGRAPTVIELQAFFDQGFIETEAQKIQRQIDKFPFGIPLEVPLAAEQKLDQQIRDISAKGAVSFRSAFESSLSPDLAAAIGFDFATGLLGGANSALEGFTPPAADTGGGGLNPKQIAGRLLGLEERLTKAEITGDLNKQLAALRDIQNFINEQLTRAVVQRRPELRRDLLQRQSSVGSAIQGIIDGFKSDRDKAADDLQKARDEADQSFLDKIAGQESKIQNRLIRASTTESLKDDLAIQKALRRFYLEKLKEVRETVRDAKTRSQEIQNLNKELAQIDKDIADSEKELADQRKEKRKQQREDARESLELDIAIAEATGNTARERSAREAEIKFLQRQIRQTRQGSLERKRLILELRQAQKELKEMKDETKKTADAQAAFAFEFLQAQQGFASNLLGNLIPLGATTGLVGNVSPAGGSAPITPGGGAGGATPVRQSKQSPGGITAQAAADSAGRAGGLTAGQATTVVFLLRRLVELSASAKAGTSAPEAQNQRATMAGRMDYGI